MPGESILPSSVEDAYFEFENTPVRLVAVRKIPRVETPGLLIKETEAGRELTVGLWVAWELIEAGLARLADDGIGGEEWTQIHYRERFQPSNKLSPLPERFYPRAYLTLSRSTREASGDLNRMESLSRLRGRYRDILESRIAKIVRLASLEAIAQSRALQPEEAELYNDLRSAISGWRREMRMEEV